MGAAGREAERLGRLESAALAGFIVGPPLAAAIASIGGWPPRSWCWPACWWP